MSRVLSLLILVVLLARWPRPRKRRRSRCATTPSKASAAPPTASTSATKRPAGRWTRSSSASTTARKRPILTTHAYMAVNVDGTKSVQEEKTADYYELEGDGPIFFAESRVTEDGQETVRTAVRDGDGLTQTIQVGKRKTQRKLPLPKSTLAMQRDLERWLQGPPKKGATFDNYTTRLGPGQGGREGSLHLQREKNDSMGRRRDGGVYRSDCCRRGEVRRQTAGRRPAAYRQDRRHGNAHGEGAARQEARRERRSDGGDLHQVGQIARPRIEHRQADAGGDRPGRFRPAGVAAAADDVA